ncbi:hypothetical protein K0B96_01410 [Horticoccus luteus]|uniref:Uncharacterized protein n=1 Tax=Horticoccus luteus TaxID=2862869 RepID=A0A8F9TU43_9BACT|nr:hypothetical protein [Horticoccus luteus]QYM79304.1 hypothetical protein K0B96_01410 [Horticoccus luteus]
MKNPAFLLACLALAVAGCSTIDSRIKEHASTFDSLSDTDKQIIRYGFIQVGFTHDMVYMALDKPEKIIPGPGPNQETWVYENFYAKDGSNASIPVRAQAVGSSRASAMKGAQGGRGTQYETVYDPSLEDVKDQAKTKVHVIFSGNRVVDIQVVRRA